jgi:hypothetical protein
VAMDSAVMAAARKVRKRMAAGRSSIDSSRTLGERLIARRLIRGHSDLHGRKRP